jgi:hypothetical protein
MKCPVCKTELVVWKRMRLETLDEHVSNPNGPVSLKSSFRCPSKTCEANDWILDKPRVFWNEIGDLYQWGQAKYPLEIPFINNNNAPFGSFQRQMNVEIYKKDENKLLLKIPCWPLNGWKLRSRYSYKSNRDGDILSRGLHFDWITNNGVWHVWGYRMLIFSLKHTWRNWKNGNYEELNDAVKRASWPRAEWWRKINAKVAKLALKFLCP